MHVQITEDTIEINQRLNKIKIGPSYGAACSHADDQGVGEPASWCVTPLTPEVRCTV